MKRASAWTPLVLTVAGTLGLGGLALYRLIVHDQGIGRVLGAVCFGLYLLWLAWESRISVKELERDQADHDRHTMEIAALAKLLTLAAAFGGGGTIQPTLAVLGIAVLVAGALVRISGIRALGGLYSHRIRTPARIETRGVFAFIRHPAYLGTLLAHTGLVMVFLNSLSVAALLLLWWPAVFLRTVVEEQHLRTLPDYEDYARRVPARLFPGLW
jgi:protein-S-isoprenylcysteine O-methyltransferase Ste14